jgi:hypothetical protein
MYNRNLGQPVTNLGFFMSNLTTQMEIVRDSLKDFVRHVTAMKNLAATNSGRYSIADYFKAAMPGQADAASTFYATSASLGLVISTNDLTGQVATNAKNPSEVYALKLNQATFERWEGRISSAIKAIDLESKLITQATATQLTALQPTLALIATDYKNVPLASNVSRTFYTLNTLGNNLTGITKTIYSNNYDNLVAQTSNFLATESPKWKALPGTDPLKTIAAFESVLSGTFNFNFNSIKKGETVIGDKWIAFKEAILLKIDPTFQQALGTKIRAQTGMTTENAIAAVYETCQKVVVGELDLFIKNDLSKLVDVTSTGLLKSKWTDYANANKFGRLVGSVFGLFAFSADMVNSIYANPDEQTKYGLSAAKTLASTMQVPYVVAFDIIMAKVKGTNAVAPIEDLMVQYRKTLGVVAGIPNEISTVFKNAGSYNLSSVAIETTGDLRQNAFYKASEASKFSLFKGKELGLSVAKNGMFLTADALSFVYDIYMVTKFNSKTPSTDIAKSVLSLASDTGFIIGDSLAAISKGTTALNAASKFIAAGAIFSVGAGMLSIAAAAEALVKNPNDNVAKGAVADSVLSTTVGLAILAAGLTFPPAMVAISLASFLIPNFASVSQAVDLQRTYNDYLAKGMTAEAQVIHSLHTVAALNATPIINWFSSVYTNTIQGQIDTLIKTPTWANQAFIERVKAEVPYMLQNLINAQKSTNIEILHMIIDKSENFTYGASKTTVTNYVDFAVRSDATQVTSVANSNGVLKAIDALLPNLNKTASAFDEIYMIEGSVRNLTLDNSLSTHKGLYILKGLSGSVTAGSADDTFSIDRDTGILITANKLAVDGGGGINKIDFSKSLSSGLYLDLTALKNFQVVVGTEGKDNVTGTNNSETYITNGGGDNVDLKGGDDTVLAMSSGGNIILGDGNDITYCSNIPASIDGGAGNDSLSFDTAQTPSLLQLSNYNLYAGGGAAGKWTGFESIAMSQSKDTVLLTSVVKGLNNLSTLGGDDAIAVGANSINVFMGDGNDRFTSMDTDILANPYDNISIFGQGGDDTISLSLNSTSNAYVSGGNGNDTIKITNLAPKINSYVEVLGGLGNDTFILASEIEATFRFGVLDGKDTIRDSSSRVTDMLLVFEQLNSSDIKIEWLSNAGLNTDYFNMKYSSTIKFSTGTAADSTTVSIDTFALPPGDISYITMGDNISHTLNIPTYNHFNSTAGYIL